VPVSGEQADAEQFLAARLNALVERGATAR
jgi:hypothetical protein